MSEAKKLSILREILGSSYKVNDEHLFFCPKCDHHKKKLSVNIAKDVYQTVTMGEEIFDTNADFNSTNDVFTAPVTGIYKLKGQYRFESVQNDANHLFELVTSDNTFVNEYNHDKLSGDMDFTVFEIQCDAPMDAGDTAKLQFKQVGGTVQRDQGSSDNPNQINTYMSGFLIG